MADSGAVPEAAIYRSKGFSMLGGCVAVLGLAAAIGLASLPGVKAAAVDPNPEPRPAISTRPTAPPQMVDVSMVAPVTGESSVNRTESRWDITGADLGSSFWYEGDLYLVFGDTFGPGGADWRSNTMARIADPTPAGGLQFTSMVSDRAGHAAELLGSRKKAGVEQTVIPTNGLAVGRRMILQYMSVRSWLTPGEWSTNYSGLAYSDDGGRTWVEDRNMGWGPDSPFAQVAFVRSGPYVYLFGIHAGRFGGAQLARVPATSVLDPSAYRYWTGQSWSDNRSAATDVVGAPVGELSVRWSASAHRWLMMYLDAGRSAIVLRTAPALTGPWSAEQEVATAAQYPQLYAPFMLPMDTGSTVYFTMSEFGPYEVYLMKAQLSPLR